MRSILRFHGKNFYLVHIHPSGNLLPSEDDILTTFSIKERGEGLGFFLLDHYILSEEESFSFKEHGFLTPFP